MTSAGDWLLLQELLERGDPAFVDRLRAVTDADDRGRFAGRWYDNPSPDARRLLLAYLERPLNAFRHEAIPRAFPPEPGATISPAGLDRGRGSIALGAGAVADPRGPLAIGTAIGLRPDRPIAMPAGPTMGRTDEEPRARDEVRRLRAILHRARAEGLDRQNRDDLPDFRAWLRGKIAFVRMARPEVGDRLLAELEALEAPSGG